jgi:two-component sensor histidine kinase/Tfp pilus assembly protein PilF
MMHPNLNRIQLVAVFCVLLLHALVCREVFAQGADNPINAQIDSLYDEAWAVSRTQPEKMLEILEDVKELHTKQDKAYKVGVLYYYRGIAHKNLSNFDESEKWFEEYIAFQKQRQDTFRISAGLMAKANLYSDQGKFAESTEAASETMSYAEAIGDTHLVIIASSKIGYMLIEAERYEEAMEYHNRSNKLARAIADIQQEEITYTNMGLTYEKQNQLDSAYVYYKKAYDMGESTNSDYNKVINRYNLATVLIKLKRYSEAKPLVSGCMSLADGINIPSLRVASRQLLGDILMVEGDYLRVVQMMDSLSGMLNHELGLKDEMEIVEMRAEAHRLNGDFESALNDYMVFKSLNDSLIGTDSREKLNELEVRYESARKEQQIAFLDLKDKASQDMISQKDRTILIGGIGLTLITVLAVVLFFLFRSYREQKQELSKALSAKELLLREIHHRVKNNLQIVSSLLSLQGRSLHDESALEAINAGKSRVRSMALIHQSLYQRENLTGVNVKEYVEKLTSELFRTYGVEEDRVQLTHQIEVQELDVDTLVPLGLIINELVTNSLKYAFPEDRSGKLIVSLIRKDSELLLKVIDDGVGFDKTAVRENAFGQKLVASLTKQLKGEMKVDSTAGTTVQLLVRSFS